MASHEFVTSFSQDGYACYGKAFIASFLKHVPHKLVVYHESQPETPATDRVTWRNLDDDQDRARFLSDHGADPDKIGSHRDYTSQSIRFCHKVFAITDAAKRSQADWITWVDADVVWHADFTPEHERSLYEHCDLCFLGRRDMPHTECGFVGYHLNQPVMRMLEDMRHYYTSGEIFTRPRKDWHDSRCFDICMQRSSVPVERRNNLSAGIRGAHVWPHTVLDQFSRHQKGRVRKASTYGGFIS